MPDPFPVFRGEAVNDTDVNWESPHHTIGAGPTQAAPGNHKHKDLATTNYVDNSTDLWYSGLRVDTSTPVAIGATYDAVWESRFSDADQKIIPWAATGFTTPKTGMYIVRLMVDFTPSVVGGRIGIYALRNGATVDYGDRFYLGTTKALVNTTVVSAPFNINDIISGRVISYEQAFTINALRLYVTGPTNRGATITGGQVTLHD